LPKKKIERPQREMTKRQLSHWQRESRMQRFIMIGGIIIVAAVLAIVGTGIYMDKYRPYQAAAVKADNKQYDMDYYIDMLAYMGLANGSTDLIQYMGDMAIQIMEQNYFYVQEASKQFGVSVSDDEVNQEFEKNKMTRNQARTDLIRGQLLENKLKDYIGKNRVPQTGDQRKVEAMFLESEKQAKSVKERIETNGEVFSDIAAQLSLEKVSKDKKGVLGSVPQGILPTLLESAANTALEDKVFSPDTPDKALLTVEDPDRTKSMGYWLLKSSDEVVAPVEEAAADAAATEGATPTPTATPTPAPTPGKDEVRLMAMLLGSKEEADDIKTQLDKGGEGSDFPTLARAHSQYDNAAIDGGDMDILTKADVKSKFGDEAVALFFPEDASKALPLNQVSDPISTTSQSTKGGVWLLRVTEILKDAPIVDSDQNNARSILITIELNKWHDEVWTANKDKVSTLMSEEQKSWAITQALLRAKI
jgi:parvulin-like peptidyl-prolyl isomerase